MDNTEMDETKRNEFCEDSLYGGETKCGAETKESFPDPDLDSASALTPVSDLAAVPHIETATEPVLVEPVLQEPALRTIALRIAYEGTNFRGWQRQPNGLRTVQGTIEDALESLLFPNGTPISMKPEKPDWPVIEVKGSSRTDAGVHALGQVGAFRTTRPYRPKAWTGALNARLPFDVRILESWWAADDFNPIGDTKRKRYRYCIFDAANPCGNLFLRPYAWGVRGPLDLDLMRQGAAKLIGTHDCIGWANTGGKRIDTVRTILDATVKTAICPKTGVDLILIEVEGTGFLYNMVRNIAGTLAEIGQGRRSIDCIDRIFETRDRTQGGITAPPGGLYLVQIWYD